MRKLFLFMMISLDGYFEGKNHSLDWHNVNEEFAEFAIRQLDETDALIFGRRTYELMASFWSTEQAKKADSETARRMNSWHKVVFSRNLTKVDWENTELCVGKLKEKISSLKEAPGKDIAVFGSSNLCISLLKDNLLDEVRLMVNPIVLGEGTTLFSGIDKSYSLNLKSVNEFKSGNTLLTYTL